MAVSVRGSGAWLDTWRGIQGAAIADLTADERFPVEPDDTVIVDSFEAPANRLDNYGARLRALLVPPATGEYTFWLASDDAGELRLSTDDTPANVKPIAKVSGYTAPRAWDANPEQQSKPVRMEAGKRYYLEALQKEGGGNDHLSVAWSGPGRARTVIPSEHLRLPAR